jgi:hypothetical protein
MPTDDYGAYYSDPVGAPFDRYMGIYNSRTAVRAHPTFPWWVGTGHNWARFDKTWALRYSQGAGEIEIIRLDLKPGDPEAEKYAADRGYPMGLQGPMGAPKAEFVVDRFKVGKDNTYSGGMGGFQRTTFDSSAASLDTYPDLWQYIDDTLERLDSELPLSVPPLMVGQVWLLPDGEQITIQGLTALGTAWTWSTITPTANVPHIRHLPPAPEPGWKLLMGPTPWGTDIPIPVPAPAEADMAEAV